VAASAKQINHKKVVNAVVLLARMRERNEKD
jgi:hypothetical protein